MKPQFFFLRLLPCLSNATESKTAAFHRSDGQPLYGVKSQFSDFNGIGWRNNRRVYKFDSSNPTTCKQRIESASFKSWTRPSQYQERLVQAFSRNRDGGSDKSINEPVGAENSLKGYETHPCAYVGDLRKQFSEGDGTPVTITETLEEAPWIEPIVSTVVCCSTSEPTFGGYVLGTEIVVGRAGGYIPGSVSPWLVSIETVTPDRRARLDIVLVSTDPIKGESEADVLEPFSLSKTSAGEDRAIAIGKASQLGPSAQNVITPGKREATTSTTIFTDNSNNQTSVEIKQVVKPVDTPFRPILSKSTRGFGHVRGITQPFKRSDFIILAPGVGVGSTWCPSRMQIAPTEESREDSSKSQPIPGAVKGREELTYSLTMQATNDNLVLFLNIIRSLNDAPTLGCKISLETESAPEGVKQED